jgi:hypothetical protein
MPAGRPSVYKPEFADQARELCERGAIDIELAAHFEVSITTIRNWKVRYPEFLVALKTGKEIIDDRVERSLCDRALGYSFDAIKILSNGSKVPYVEHVPPDTTACIFWLKNRRPDLWRDKHDHEHSGKDGRPIAVSWMLTEESSPTSPEHSSAPITNGHNAGPQS